MEYRNTYLPEYTELTKSEARVRRGVLTSCRCFRSWNILLSQMTDEEAGKVWKLMYKYMRNSKIETADLDPLSDLARAFLQMAISSIEDNVEREIGKAFASISRKDAKEKTKKKPQNMTQPAEEYKPNEKEIDYNGYY